MSVAEVLACALFVALFLLAIYDAAYADMVREVRRLRRENARLRADARRSVR